MSCLVCLENVDGSEMSEDEVWCNGHVVHSECLSQWCQRQKISMENAKCLICNIGLGKCELEKVRRFYAAFKEKIFDITKRNNIAEFKKFVNQKRILSEACFNELIKVAMDSKSLRVLKYLHQIERMYFTYSRIKILTLELCESPNEMNIRWLSNNFDANSFEVPPIASKLDIIQLMQTHSRFQELLWCYQAYYTSLPEKAQFDYLLHIFRAYKNYRFEYKDGPKGFMEHHSPNSYYLILFSIAIADLENCCHMLKGPIPYVMMKEFDPTNGSFAITKSYINLCPNCTKSHTSDAVLLAIQEGEVEFLCYLLAKHRKIAKPPVRTVELAQIIAKLDRREEVMAAITNFKRWKGVRKLKRLYKKVLEKPTPRFRFWNSLIR